MAIIASSMFLSCGEKEDSASPSSSPTISDTSSTEDGSLSSSSISSADTSITEDSFDSSSSAEHTHTYLDSTVDPTCTEDGYDLHVCQDCGYSYQDNIVEALGHNLTFHVDSEATCTEKGWGYYGCSRCGYVSYEEIGPLGHDFSDDYTTDVEPTCTETGIKSRHCSRCDAKTDSQKIPASGHDIVHHEGKAATCVDDGCADYDTCKNCDYTTYQVIKAHGQHEYGKDNILDAAPTCTEEGQYSQHCLYCDAKTNITTIPALGHSLVHHDGQAATCTEEGWEEYATCERCDYSSKVTIAALGHKFPTTYTIEKVPTDSEEGQAYRNCLTCGEKADIETIPTLQNTDSSVVFTGPSTIEVGAIATIRSLYSGAHSNALVSMFVDDNTILQLPSLTTNIASMSVTGLKVGTCKIIAISVENPKIFNVFSIEVVSARYDLQTALNKISQYTNYTLTSYPENEEDRTNENTHVLKRVENGFTLMTSSGKPIITQTSDTNTYGYFGIGLDAKGYAAYLDKEVTTTETGTTYGSYKLNSERVVGTDGFLTSNDFAGRGVNNTSVLETQFTTLGDINYNWAPTGKNSNNHYTIEGNSDDANAAYLESIIWNLVDPDGFWAVVRANGLYDYINIADYIDTTALVNEDGTADFTISPTKEFNASYADGTTGVYSLSYTGHISNVGTTALDEETTTLLSNEKFISIAPALSEDLQNARNALLGNNYVKVIDYLGDGSACYNIYYTENYVFFDYNSEFVTAVKEAGKTLDESIAPFAYYASDDGYIHRLEMDFNYNVQNDIAMANPVVGTEHTNNLHYLFNYYETSMLETYRDGSGWYALSDQAYSIVGSEEKYHYTFSESVRKNFVADGYDNGHVDIDDDGNITDSFDQGASSILEAISGVNVEIDTNSTTPESVNFLMAFSLEANDGSQSIQMIKTTYKGFGKATTNNANDKLQELLKKQSYHVHTKENSGREPFLQQSTAVFNAILFVYEGQRLIYILIHFESTYVSFKQVAAVVLFAKSELSKLLIPAIHPLVFSKVTSSNAVPLKALPSIQSTADGKVIVFNALQ